MKWYEKAKNLPVWVGIIALALSGFIVFFCALLPLSGEDESVGPKRINRDYVERSYDPLGSDPFWQDTECYEWQAAISCHLYRASTGNGAFAYSRNAAGVTPPIIGAKSESIPNQWKWGFSLGAGTKLFHYDWDIFAGYQYFSDQQTKGIPSPMGGVLVPLKSISLNGQSVSEAKSRVNLLLNQLDLEVRKRFHFHENLLIKADMGVRSTWLKNDQRTLYTGGNYLNAASVTVNQENRFWGIGPLTGVEAKWLWMDNFYLLSQAKGSLEYTINRARYEESQSNSPAALIQMFQRLNYVAPSMSLKIGAGLSNYVLNDDMNVSINLSYDAQFFWNRSGAIEAEPFSAPRFFRSNSDVTLQGFALSFNFLY